ncbi:hypothetical protein HFP57_13585 [Parasphingopyxis algicola]|uniref:hypothetical protein n=1 Tax=Parasphingopyxis algicola TaxID=2026624 RepID=UPI0015A2015F|nr:hypothetical protein [Parasphingopyxis algicola]QLC25953.1 hypothetical protein HFP57_13585 [Parasphingopyxis algicola]
MADPDPPRLPAPQKEPLTLSLSKGCPSSSTGQSKGKASTGSAQTELVETNSPALNPPALAKAGDWEYRTRHDGWTTPRKRKFLHALARTGCVRDACAIAHISSTSAYRHRRRDAGFAAAWERALTEALPVLEAAAFERAVEGVWEPVVSGGKVAVYRKRYSDAILVTLLKRADAAADRRAADDIGEEDAIAALDAQLAIVKARMEGGAFPEGDDADGG